MLKNAPYGKKKLFSFLVPYVALFHNAPSGIRTRVPASKGPDDWPDYTNGADFLIKNLVKNKGTQGSPARNTSKYNVRYFATTLGKNE